MHIVINHYYHHAAYHGGHYGGGNTVVIHNTNNFNNYNNSRRTSNTVNHNMANGGYNANRAAATPAKGATPAAKACDNKKISFPQYPERKKIVPDFLIKCYPGKLQTGITDNNQLNVN